MILRNQQNTKIIQTIKREELMSGNCAGGMNFTAPMVNAMFDGTKTHTCRKADDMVDDHKSYLPGAIYYVRETVLYKPGSEEKVYIADLEDLQKEKTEFKKQGFVNKQSFFFPKDFARLAIRITTKGVKRLHDLTHEERIAEGIRWKLIGFDICYYDYVMHIYKFNTKFMEEEKASFECFKSLWVKIHDMIFWDENPLIYSLFYEPLLIL
jgi:hypothetical protein